MENTSPTRWTCPQCGRHFAKPNQWHSCDSRGIEEHFRGKDPYLKAIFDKLIFELQELAPVRVDAVKTSINLIAKYHFGGVEVQTHALRIGFLARQQIEDKRIDRATELGANRIGHSVKITSPDDVDNQLLRWLVQAYELQS